MLGISSKIKQIFKILCNWSAVMLYRGAKIKALERNRKYNIFVEREDIENDGRRTDYLERDFEE